LGLSWANWSRFICGDFAIWLKGVLELGYISLWELSEVNLEGGGVLGMERLSLKRLRGEDVRGGGESSFTGNSEIYVKQGSEMGVCSRRAPLLGNMEVRSFLRAFLFRGILMRFSRNIQNAL
jgi:hypothetical protein